MTEAQLDKRYDKARSIVNKVYNRIYSETGSNYLDDQLHDTMLYQLDGMEEDYGEILYDIEHSIEILPNAFDAIDATVKFAKSVAKAMDACNKITSPVFG